MPHCKIFCTNCNKGIVIQAQILPDQVSISCRNCDQSVFEYQVRPYQAPAAKITRENIFTPEKLFAGRYSYIKLLGEGGMSKVYLMEDKQNQERVAVKVLRNIEQLDLFTQMAEELKRKVNMFLREAGILWEINHPNIVKLKDVGNYQGQPYIVMEYIDGMNMRNYVKQCGPFPCLQAAEFICALCQTLSYAYEKFQLIHRDIKPANIILQKQGPVYIPKLIDLGLAKIIGDTSLTASHEMLGTACYMAPEQIENAKHASHYSDIYALGALFYYLLTGSPPYSEYKDIRSILLAKYQGKPCRPIEEAVQAQNREIASPIINAVKKAMAHDPKDRFTNSQQLREFLRNEYVLPQKSKQS